MIRCRMTADRCVGTSAYTSKIPAPCTESRSPRWALSVRQIKLVNARLSGSLRNKCSNSAACKAPE